MKNKILTLIIGALIGAIITSAGFVVYIKTNNTSKKHDFGGQSQMNQRRKSDDSSSELPSGEKKSRKTKSNSTNSTATNSSTTNDNSNTTSTQTNEQVQSNS